MTNSARFKHIAERLSFALFCESQCFRRLILLNEQFNDAFTYESPAGKKARPRQADLIWWETVAEYFGDG